VILGTLAVRSPEQAGEAFQLWSRCGRGGAGSAATGWRRTAAKGQREDARRFSAAFARWACASAVTDGSPMGTYGRAVEATAALGGKRPRGDRVRLRGSLDDLRALRAAGDIAGVVIGQALYRGVFTLPEALAAE